MHDQSSRLPWRLQLCVTVDEAKGVLMIGDYRWSLAHMIFVSYGARRILGFSVMKKIPGMTAIPIYLPSNITYHKCHRNVSNITPSALTIIGSFFVHTTQGWERLISKLNLTSTEYCTLLSDQIRSQLRQQWSFGWENRDNSTPLHV